jgi:hypothetical protein
VAKKSGVKKKVSKNKLTAGLAEEYDTYLLGW